MNAGFEHVITATNAKTAEMAATAATQKHGDQLGHGVPGFDERGNHCVEWIKKFVAESMQQHEDGRWVFLVDGMTKPKLKELHARVQQWKSNKNSNSYLKEYNKFQAILLNAVQIMPQ